MGRLSDRQRDVTYVTLHIAELQRMVHTAVGSGKINLDLGTDFREADAEIYRALLRCIGVLARGSERNSVVATHRLPEVLADAVTRILDLAERTGIDLGEAVVARLGLKP